MLHSHRHALLGSIALLIPVPAAAQALPTAADPAVAPAPTASTAGSKRVFTATDFARFAPRTAYDMLIQVPGFTLRAASQERGLGQASENVLIDGQRIANKSGGAIVELQKINVGNVERIEIVEAASIGIAGLSGQVANVILKEIQAASGQFEWRPEFRAHYATPTPFRGLLSYSGGVGPVDYTISLQNQGGHGAFGGPALISDASATVFETRELELTSDFDNPDLTAKFALDGAGSSIGNLSVAWKPYRYRFRNDERRERTDGNHRDRLTLQSQDGYFLNFNADYSFGLGPGKLKLIGLRNFEHEPTITSQVTSFDSGVPDEGVKFERDARIRETVGRLEYGWSGGSNEWQLSVERADNRLKQEGKLFILGTDGEFDQIDFPQGSGEVYERRYEAIASFSRPLTPKLDVQIDGGGEVSRLERVDGDVPARKFFRPKGSVSLGWRPAENLDASVKLRRRVGQISFYDFLAQPNLQQDRENAGNPDLVPPQSWELETEVGRNFGDWGKTRIKFYAHRIDDIIDIIPIGEVEEAIGNLPRATKLGFENTSTLQFDPIGWTGAKLDFTVGFERNRVRDPLTGEKRPISGTQDRWLRFNLRHDVAGTDFAWGAGANQHHNNRRYFLSEISRETEGPWFVSVFVEHKDLFGMTARATVGNILNARHYYDRTVYAGRRNAHPIAFVERHDQLIGPIFSFLFKGNF